MIRLSCPSCGKSLRANDADAGKRTRCTGCKAILTITPPNRPQDFPASDLAVDDRIQVSGGAFPMTASPNTVICPHCAGPILNDPALAGHSVHCPHCQGVIQMPGTEPVNVELVAVPNPGPMVTFRCPHCQSVQTFAMEFAGQVVKCPQYSLPLQVPVLQGQPLTSGATGSSKTSGPGKPPDSFDFDDVLAAEEKEIYHSSRGRNRGNGVVALMLGLLSFFVIPILGPVAVIVGSGALKDDPNDGCAKAGYILGWISTACVILFLVVFCLLLLAPTIIWHSR